MINKSLIGQIADSLSKTPKMKLAYALGSVVKGREKDDSDFDLVVVVEDKDRADYNAVYKLVSGLSFPKDLDLSVVDKKSSPLFLFQIVSTGKCVFKISEEEKVLFEAYVLKNYYDNAHLRNIYYSYLKDKFPYANQ